jgi:hypothetical protein
MDEESRFLLTPAEFGRPYLTHFPNGKNDEETMYRETEKLQNLSPILEEEIRKYNASSK